MVETYKKIEGFENYSVSDFGNVRNDKTKRIFKRADNGRGYLHVCLVQNKIRHNKLIHKLTAGAFFI